ncbi:hypothetical protein DFA_08901 [Cavenderia fasciculata]|uniref:F-box domain-containing protein n=1 Tax=Cavenderia fasciculata TaxID=261658 RepID=F4Q4V4_CACFS|nr:uncharacterized protein DFA_08901 [Cavenderia fasciculata]EGG17900.1 hypothetical protein DFA_08901 [Cavenderia fasciculata]|eukprot:XP_004356384.1 hypothetical protein DFA_08901 [Cavenderia fasciculata]
MNTLSSSSFLPLYVQSIIINKLINYTNDHICSRTISDSCEEPERAPYYDRPRRNNILSNTPIRSNSEICKLLYTGELPHYQHRGHNQLINLALVSKWWFQVVRGTRTELTIIGRFTKDIFIPFIQQQQHSIYQLCNIQKIHWSCLLVNYDDDVKDYTYVVDEITPSICKEIIDLLPHLDTINIKTRGGIWLEYVSKTINQILVLVPNLKSTMLLELAEKDFTEMHGFTPNHSTMVVHIRDSIFDETNYPDNLDHLKPSYVCLFQSGQLIQVHCQYKDMFSRQQRTKHITLNDDYVDLMELYDLVTLEDSKLESLEVSVLIIPSEEDGGALIYDTIETYHPDDEQVETFDGEEWAILCDGLQDNTTLKRLLLKDYYRCQIFSAIDCPILTIPIFEIPFRSLWENNATIEYLGLSYLSHIISSQFFDEISLNQTITTMVLDVSGNMFGKYATNLYNALLQSDTVQYLVVDQDYRQCPINQLDYFLKSKSLKDYFYTNEWKGDGGGPNKEETEDKD